MHDTISSTEKCCYGCFLLADVLQAKRQKTFKLLGTHGRIYPWMPPACLDVEILTAMKDLLCCGFGEDCRTAKRDPVSSEDEDLSYLYKDVIKRAMSDHGL